MQGRELLLHFWLRGREHQCSFDYSIKNVIHVLGVVIVQAPHCPTTVDDWDYAFVDHCDEHISQNGT